MLKKILKFLIPQRLRGDFYQYFSFLVEYLHSKEVSKVRRLQEELRLKFQQKEKLKVLFIVTHTSIWKYEELYFLLEKDPKFEPVIGVAPVVVNQKINLESYQQTLNFFDQNAKKVISCYDSENKEWLDLKLIVSPDVVFFSNCNKLTLDKYHIEHFTNVLTCYVPYAFVVIYSLEGHYGKLFHHLLWKYFVETQEHLKYANSYLKKSLVNNAVVTGFPGLDVIFKANYKPKNVWKKIEDPAHKIIWAPHHTIGGQGSGLDYSSFQEYHKYFIELCQNNSNIQIAFKPHPLLKQKLYIDADWGIEKTDMYYKKWETLQNGQLEIGGYIDLFATSDAMIMDSASFIAEYLYFDKPILFTMRDEKVKERFNSFGQEIFNYLYTSKNIEETEGFIENQVVKKIDDLKQERNQFLKERILPKNGKTASKNIYNELRNQLCQN